MKSSAGDNHIDYVELPASTAATLAAAKQFYHAVFGWTYKDWGPEYSDTQSSGVSSGITVDAPRFGKPMAVIFSSDLEKSRAAAISAGAKLTKDIFSFPGGRRFQFVDPAGNELAVWSDR